MQFTAVIIVIISISCICTCIIIKNLLYNLQFLQNESQIYGLTIMYHEAIDSDDNKKVDSQKFMNKVRMI